MAARLTDKKKKQIIADYVELGSYNAVAKMQEVSATTVKKLVLADKETVQKCEQKKEQNTADILAHMESKRDKVNMIIDVYLDKLLDPELLKRTTPIQLTTSLGILIDKFTMDKVAVAGTEREEDPLSKSLREEAEKMNRGNQ